MQESVIQHAIEETVRATTDGIGEACAEADETKKTINNLAAYKSAVNAKNLQDAIAATDKSGSMLSTGMQKSRIKVALQNMPKNLMQNTADGMKKIITRTIKRANTWGNAPILAQDIDLIDKVTRNNTIPTALDKIGIDSVTHQIKDVNTLLNSDEFRATFSDDEYRNGLLNKNSKFRTDTTVQKEISNLLLNDSGGRFRAVFNDDIRFGKLIPENRIEQMEDGVVKQYAYKYNRAIMSQRIAGVADKILNAQEPQAALEKFIQEANVERQVTNDYLGKDYLNALVEVTDHGVNGMPPEIQKNIAREIKGESTGDANASKVARAIRRLYKLKQNLLNTEGMHVKFNDDYLPTYHNRRLIADNLDQWKGMARKVFDFERMDIKPNEIDDYLNRTGQGFKNHINSTARGTTVGAKKSIIFKDVDGYLDYHQNFSSQKNILSIMDRFISESAEQVTNARRFGDPDGSHVLTDMVNGKANTRAQILNAGDIALQKGDTQLLNELHAATDNPLYTLKDPAQSATSRLNEIASVNGALTPNILKFLRSATTTDELHDFIPSMSKKGLDYVTAVERYMSGELPQAAADQTGGVVSGLTFAARHGYRLACALMSPVYDGFQRILSQTEVKDIAAGVANTFAHADTSYAQRVNLGLNLSHTRAAIIHYAENMERSASRQLWDQYSIKNDIGHFLDNTTQSALRTDLLLDMQQNIAKTHDLLPPYMRNIFDPQAWETLRKVGKNGQDFLLDRNGGKTVFTNPIKILNDEGFTVEEHQAAAQIQAAIDQYANASKQTTAFATRVKQTEIKAAGGLSTLEKGIALGMSQSGGVIRNFADQTFAPIVRMFNQGRYGSIAAVFFYGLMLSAFKQTLAKTLQTGQFPGIDTFDDPEFWMSSLEDTGYLTGWTITTALKLHNAKDFGGALASLTHGSGLQTAYDVAQTASYLATGDTKNAKQYARKVMNGDLSPSHVPIIGRYGAQLITVPIMNSLAPTKTTHHTKQQQQQSS